MQSLRHGRAAGGYNFYVKEKKKIPAYQTRCRTHHYLIEKKTFCAQMDICDNEAI